jgi:hypothetical protein
MKIKWIVVLALLISPALHAQSRMDWINFTVIETGHVHVDRGDGNSRSVDSVTVQADDPSNGNVFMRYARFVITQAALFHWKGHSNMNFSIGSTFRAYYVMGSGGSPTILQVQVTDEKGKVKTEMHGILF